MFTMKVAILFIFAFAEYSVVNGYRILSVYTTLSRSHFIPAEALLFGLAERGHQITAITQFPPDKQHKNYRHITMDRYHKIDELMELVTNDPGNKFRTLTTLPMLIDVFEENQDRFMENEQFKQIMDEEKFDLVILELPDEALHGLGAHFKCPIISFCSFKGYSKVFDLTGNPYGISYIPHVIARYNGLLGFKERVLTFIWYILDNLMVRYMFSRSVAQYNRYFPQPEYPTIEEISKNISAIFISHHFSQGDVRPNVPAIVEVGGIQMKNTANALPEDLQTWMDTSNNGVIFFSLGSNMKTKNIPKTTLEAILAVFGKLKLNVLWKSDINEIPGLSDNVKIKNWVSQTDVLQHKHLKLFITHGGFGSVTESKYYGVPALVIPVFADQMTNAEQVEYEGWGVKLDFLNVNEETLSEAIAEIMQNPKYRNRVEYEKILYRDRPLTALETGIYWTEYVIRHGGAKHMRSNAIHLNFFQLHSLDVIGFLALVAVVILYIDYKIFKYILYKLCKKTKSKRD